MTVLDPEYSAIGEMQQHAHGAGHDYTVGSPHLTHAGVRGRVTEAVRHAVLDVIDRRGSCTVLEVGAGHGTFTDVLVAAGATATVTEMSAPSAATLLARYRHNDRVRVVHDPDGSASLDGAPVDLVACVSVLHHIPDYVAAVRAWTARIRPGGTFLSYQDPMWRPRLRRGARLASRAAYLSWRAPRGDLARGLAATVRKARGEFDESEPSDMVEYHARRDGVDEQALAHVLRPAFAEVVLDRYWSTQGGAQQALGELTRVHNTFGVVATGRASA